MWVLCSALLCLSYSASNNAQNLTGNVVYTTVNPAPAGAQYNWTGFVVNNTGGGGFSGGNQPAYNTQTGTFIFGYMQGTVSYNMAVNSALANAGSGIQVSGFNYSWQYYNQEFSRGTLSGTIGLTDSAGKTLHSYNYTMPKTTDGWTVMSGTQIFPTEYAPAGLGNLNVSFTGKDDRYWAGYYGPQIRDIDVRLRYSVDPCATNPAYSPTCPGFSNVVTSGNLVPNPGAVATWGSGINNSYAINSAFRQAGTGLQVHGFEYGFYASAGDYCAFELIWCFDNRKPSAQVNVNITNSSGSSLHSNQYNISNQQGNFSNRYLFSQSQQLGNLGTFSMTAGTADNAVVSNMYSRAIYTPDLCMRSPSSSPACPGYVAATSSPTSTPPTVDSTSISPTATAVTQTSPTSAPVTSTSMTEVSPVASTSAPQTSSPSTSATTSASTSSASTANNSQSRPGEVAVSGSSSQTSSSSQSTMSVGQLLSIVRAEQNRVSRLETSTAAAAVEQATRESEKATAEAQTTAATQQAAVVAANDAAVSAIVSAATTPTQQLGSGLQVSSATANSFAVAAVRDPVFGSQMPTQQNQVTVSTFGSIAPTVSSGSSESQVLSFNRRQEIEEIVNQQTADSGSNNMAFSATNPLNNYVNPPTAPAEAAPASTGPVVNRNVQPNSAAGGRDIAVIATAPPGFDAYTAGTVPDGAFYAPREIYRNQRTVDNARAQRALSGGSDRLHREMVDQQYRISQ